MVPPDVYNKCKIACLPEVICYIFGRAMFQVYMMHYTSRFPIGVYMYMYVTNKLLCNHRWLHKRTVPSEIFHFTPSVGVCEFN